MADKKFGLFFGVPVHSNVSIHFTQACLNIQRYCDLNNIPCVFYMLQGSLVTHNRNLIVSQFLQSGDEFTHLVFIDSDIYFSVETIMNMISTEKEVIASPYPMKYFDWNKMWNKIQKGDVQSADQLMSAGLTFPVKVKDDKSILTPQGYMEISHVPTGCLTIKRNVLHQMIEEYPDLKLEEKENPNDKEVRPFFYNFFDCYHDKENGKYYGEDFGFSLLWTKMGGKIYAYIMEDIAHIGDFAFHGRMYDDLTYKIPLDKDHINNNININSNNTTKE